MDQTDKTDEAQNYFFGIKDPFFNKNKYNAEELGGYLSYTGEASIDPINIDTSDLFDADPYIISKTQLGNQVSGGIAGISTWKQLLVEARSDTYDGWVRPMCDGAITEEAGDDNHCSDSGPSERLINEPSILGGIVLFPTFSPSSDICGFGGFGRLWALYYETGTAFRYYIFGNSNQDPIDDVIFLGSGIASSFGLHIGRQEGSTLFTQMSTGIVLELDLNITTETIQPTYWRDYLE